MTFFSFFFFHSVPSSPTSLSFPSLRTEGVGRKARHPSRLSSFRLVCFHSYSSWKLSKSASNSITRKGGNYNKFYFINTERKGFEYWRFETFFWKTAWFSEIDAKTGFWDPVTPVAVITIGFTLARDCINLESLVKNPAQNCDLSPGIWSTYIIRMYAYFMAAESTLQTTVCAGFVMVSHIRMSFRGTPNEGSGVIFQNLVWAA